MAILDEDIRKKLEDIFWLNIGFRIYQMVQEWVGENKSKLQIFEIPIFCDFIYKDIVAKNCKWQRR